jgi:predicted fused transcriptional regulator/phosphomethylpyrimidine kinase
VVDRLGAAVAMLESCPEFAVLVPEVRTNLAYALPDAAGPGDIAAVDGRITVVGGMPKAAGPVEFGASDHLARRIIELRKHDDSVRAALNFRWNERVMEFMYRWCADHGFQMGAVDRADEPKQLLGRDKGSMEWKVKRLVKSLDGVVPPVFYESRGWGKEPLFLLVGHDPVALAEQACVIAREFAAQQS